MIEILSKFFHENTWGHWMKYLFKVSTPTTTVVGFKVGTVINSENTKRWKRQMNTNYEDLPEKEKDSDRNIAKEFNEYLKANGYKIVRIIENHDDEELFGNKDWQLEDHPTAEEMAVDRQNKAEEEFGY